jgi:hypothetical protein
MAADESSHETRSASPAAKLSKTPSWVMLGFILGAVFVAALPPWRRPPAPEAVSVAALEPVRPPVPREPAPLTTIEAVFAEWQRHAVWSDDTTEVALWNIREKAFTDFYEVRRVGDALYFRTIPKLTRRIVTHGKPLPNSPLQFTETEEQYQEWREHGRSERPAAQDLRPRISTPPIDPTIAPSSSSKEGFTPKFEVPAVPPGVIK